jgi:hypothetical protein
MLTLSGLTIEYDPIPSYNANTGATTMGLVVGGYGYYKTTYVWPDNLTLTRNAGPAVSPPPFARNPKLTMTDAFTMKMQGRILKDFGPSDMFIRNGVFTPPTSISVKFPWLPIQTVDTQFVEFPNGADFNATYAPGGRTDTCYDVDLVPDSTCYNKRGIGYDNMPFARIKDLRNIQFQITRYFPDVYAVQSPWRGYPTNYVLNHPFCQANDNFSVTKEVPINDAGQAPRWNRVRKVGGVAESIAPPFDASGSIFSCQIMRYFLSRGDGVVMPVTISFVM